MQDLLAMTALQLSTKGGVKTPASSDQTDFTETAAALSQLVNELDSLK
jgi:hypothetical protein